MRTAHHLIKEPSWSSPVGFLVSMVHHCHWQYPSLQVAGFSLSGIATTWRSPKITCCSPQTSLISPPTPKEAENIRISRGPGAAWVFCTALPWRHLVLRHAPCASLSLLVAQSGLGRELGCLEVAPRLLERRNWRSQTTGWCGATHRVPVSQRHSATSQEVLWGMPTLTKAQHFAGSVQPQAPHVCCVTAPGGLCFTNARQTILLFLLRKWRKKRHEASIAVSYHGHNPVKKSSWSESTSCCLMAGKHWVSTEYDSVWSLKHMPILKHPKGMHSSK